MIYYGERMRSKSEINLFYLVISHQCMSQPMEQAFSPQCLMHEFPIGFSSLFFEHFPYMRFSSRQALFWLSAFIVFYSTSSSIQETCILKFEI